MTNDTNINFFDGTEKVRVVKCSKKKSIQLTKKAWNKVVNLAPTVDQYVANRNKGRWFLDASWYIHTKLDYYQINRSHTNTQWTVALV